MALRLLRSLGSPGFRSSIFGKALLPLIFLLGLALGAGGLLLIQRTGRVFEDPEARWDREHFSQILDLKYQAESLAGQGRLVEAHRAYYELQRLVGSHAIKDPVLFDHVDAARADQAQVYGLLLADVQRRQQQAASQPPPGTQPTTSTASYPKQFNDPLPAPKPIPPELLAGPPMPAEGSGFARSPGSTASSLNPEPRTLNPSTNPSHSPSPPRPLASSSSDLDAQVGQSIQRGVDFLLKQFEDDEINCPEAKGTYKEGLNALCVYALLQAGQAIPDPRLDIRQPTMKRLVSRMKQHIMAPEAGEVQSPVTYAIALRTAALSVYNREEDRDLLKEDLKWLLAAHVNGAYTYDDQFSNLQSRRDDSSGFGVRGSPSASALPFDVRSSMFDVQSSMENSTIEDRTLNTEHRINGPSPSLLDLWTGDSRDFFIPTHNGEKIPALPPRLTPPRQIPRPVPKPTAPPVVRFPWDNSNSQYGLLGVWSAAEAGYEVPDKFFADVDGHWRSCQLPDGQWGYNAFQTQGSFGMTVAGIASLLVTHDYYEIPRLGGKLLKEPYSGPLAKGLAWLESDDNAVGVMDERMHYLGYNLYGLERVGLASGFKYFGKHDWYRELAARALSIQYPNGAWGKAPEGRDAIIDTAYTLLFLSRGRHPILMNKLRFEGQWANRPRDIANLTRFAGRELERPLNWQVVNLQSDWSDWLDAPILYLAGSQPPKLNPADLEKLRQFVEAGGLLFTHCDANNDSFNRFAYDLAAKLFPSYEMQDLPPNDELYSLQYKIAFPRPRLRVVRNGTRILMVHSPQDLAGAWQQRAEKTKRGEFELGVNLFIYAAGKADLRNRLASPYLPEPAEQPTGTVKVARLKYPGNWDPEPGAWRRFARYFQGQTGVEAQTKAIEIKDLADQTAEEITFAHLTGTAAHTFNDADASALAAFVERGGVLLIDNCGGSPAFAASVQTLLTKAFPNTKPQAMKGDHPLLKGDGAALTDLSKPRLRPYALAKLGPPSPHLHLLTGGKGTVIYSDIDLTSGLLGTHTWGILGYDPSYAQELLKNVVIWTSRRNTRQD